MNASRSLRPSHALSTRALGAPGRRTSALTAISAVGVGLAGLVGTFALGTPAAQAQSAPTAPITQSGTEVVPGAAESDEVTRATNRELSPQAFTDLASIKAAATAEVNERLARLAVLQGRITTAPANCGMNAIMSTQLANDAVGLQSLNTQIQSLTELSDAKAAYTKIFGDFRIFALQNPKAHLINNCAKDLARINVLRDDLAKTLARIEAARAAGADTSAAQAQLATAVAALDSAQATDIAGASSVIGLVPDKGDRNVLAYNSSVLKSAQAQFVNAQAQLNAAAKSAEAARKSVPTFKVKVSRSKPARSK